MTAFACLRVIVSKNTQSLGTTNTCSIIDRVVLAYLESRWHWPRRYGEISPFAYLLADPQATDLDPDELLDLSREVHLKLFGTETEGEVCMVTLEGDRQMITRFAAIDATELRNVLNNGGHIDGISGRITEITPKGVRAVLPRGQVLQSQLATESVSSDYSATSNNISIRGEIFHAIWNASKEAFIGNCICSRVNVQDRFAGITNGPEFYPQYDSAREFDIENIINAIINLSESFGVLFVPINFTNIMNSHYRQQYVSALSRMPIENISRIGVTLYGVPRYIDRVQLKLLRSILEPHFGVIDLQTSDYDFDLPSEELGSIRSITFTLPNSNVAERIAIASRFIANTKHYRARRLWQAITNIKTRRELELGIKNGVIFLSGSGISSGMKKPIRPVYHQAAELPWDDHKSGLQ